MHVIITVRVSDSENGGVVVDEACDVQVDAIDTRQLHYRRTVGGKVCCPLLSMAFARIGESLA